MNNPLEQATQLLTAGIPAERITTDVAHPARMYDHYPGGRDTYLADRDAADHAPAILPEVREIAHANRDFHRRALTFLTREHGINQVLDLGAGLPRTDDTTGLARALRRGPLTGALLTRAARRRAANPCPNLYQATAVCHQTPSASAPPRNSEHSHAR